MSFLVNLAGGLNAISGGNLTVGSAGRQWNTTFQGDLSGPIASMKGFSGTYTNGTDPAVGLDAANIRGVFVGTGSQPAFLSGFTMEAGPNKVQGLMLNTVQPPPI
jgi:hypothetical protein